MISENVDVRRRCEPRCAKSDNPNCAFPPLAIDPPADDGVVAFRSATENAATETVAIAMDFNTDEPVVIEEDEEDVDAALASWSKHASSSMVSSRVLSSFVEKRVIYSAAPQFCARRDSFTFFFSKHAHTHTLDALFFFEKSQRVRERERERNKAISVKSAQS